MVLRKSMRVDGWMRRDGGKRKEGKKERRIRLNEFPELEKRERLDGC